MPYFFIRDNVIIYYTYQIFVISTVRKWVCFFIKVNARQKISIIVKVSMKRRNLIRLTLHFCSSFRVEGEGSKNSYKSS